MDRIISAMRTKIASAMTDRIYKMVITRYRCSENWLMYLHVFPPDSRVSTSNPFLKEKNEPHSLQQLNYFVGEVIDRAHLLDLI